MTRTTEATKESTDGAGLTVDDLAREVGRNVRSIRSRRGLTRKNLAHHSEVSERYLAQLEQGTANISLALLWRIAQALGVRIGALLPAQEKACIKYPPLGELIETFPLEIQRQAHQLLSSTFAKERAPCKGVALIGLRGGGKSTLGRRLARHFGLPFVSLHERITELAGMEMDELFSLTGQGSYRRLELEALRQTMERHPQVVLETGGSLVSEAETYRILRDNFFTVWIRALPEDHMARVIGQGDMRPMADSPRAMEDLKLILKEREPDYRLADYQLMTSGHSEEESFGELLRACASCLQTGK
ncbi:MAG TPA: helix-turn-helix domain-containing protein [Sedimenticola thiotaurini]|uniref:Shikimate kinase n=1 Tax=Sedimenticola thiotaurini TaxID=1543721 RepID=A0A831W4F8_9GAMM|nr:helix-turn-helix domain-containing protein [Sedimenticola thiotaurini]